ncbi:MAG TPA: glutamate--tRNA ligase [Bryobacteraceae bacterium]|nr:glutamate--tRNA ligase [Bryobacteraceae bacterium]
MSAPPRVRFAPSPTGFLHIGSARTFIFNWLYARHHDGTMILRIDDTDVDRNTQASLDSIFEGLKWLDLRWDEEYHQSQRLALHQQMAWRIFEQGLAYRDYTPAAQGAEEKPYGEGAWLFNPGMRDLSPEASRRRAEAGEPFVLRFRVPRDGARAVQFRDGVYGYQSKECADIEDFALLRSNGIPTYHMASCADDLELLVSHIIRGQDHLTNTFKHVLIFEALGAAPPQFAHLPLLLAPDGSKLSKRKHGPVVSVTTYRDAGFLPHAYVNFLCLLGWSPKDDREKMSLDELVRAFSFEGINRDNAVVNFQENDPFDPKAVWLNAEYIRATPIEDLARLLTPFVCAAGFHAEPGKMLQVTKLIRERIRLLSEVATVADFFFLDELPPYDPAELIPQKGDRQMALLALQYAREVLTTTDFYHQALEASLRQAAMEISERGWHGSTLKIKTGQMFQPIRVAVCGRKAAPPLFETLEVLGRETCLKRIDRAIAMLK